MKKLTFVLCLLIAVIGVMPGPAQATLLTHVSFQTSSSGGSQGSGSQTADMIYSYYTGEGWGWAGGAIGVNGSAATHSPGGSAVNPANVSLKFSVGPTVDSLNTTYGAGNWTIDNVKLALSSSGAMQGNPRFGLGAGSFDIYWAGNDAWAQSKGTATNREYNPIYAADATTLLTWAGSQALLDNATYSLISSSYFTVTENLGLESLFVNDIVSATAGSNPNVSLYLMATSPALGMVIYNGGQAQALPTLSFDVVSAAPVPIPGAVWLLGPGLAAVGFIKRRSRKA